MKELLLGQFRVIASVTRTNLAGIDHASSLIPPAGGGNCVYWLVGHLTNTYNSMLPTLGQQPVWDDAVAQLFARGSSQLDPASVTITFTDLVEHLETAASRLAEGIAALDEARYSEPAPYSPSRNPDETLISLLSTVAFHQAYHCGQIGTHRHAAGLEGAIA